MKDGKEGKEIFEIEVFVKQVYSMCMLRSKLAIPINKVEVVFAFYPMRYRPSTCRCVLLPCTLLPF